MRDVESVAERLFDEHISVEVVDLRTVAPFDRTTVLASVAKTGRAVIVHEAVRPLGGGAEVAAVINEELFGQLAAPVQRVGSAFTPVPTSPPLEAAFLYSQSEIETAIRRTLR
jgi:pyruvate dehydrogenase E1 component beta subunit